MAVRHMSCRHCGMDIEGFSPYRKGEWMDRGGNTRCPTPEGDAGQVHAPVRPTFTVGGQKTFHHYRAAVAYANRQFLATGVVLSIEIR